MFLTFGFIIMNITRNSLTNMWCESAQMCLHDKHHEEIILELQRQFCSVPWQDMSKETLGMFVHFVLQFLDQKERALHLLDQVFNAGNWMDDVAQIADTLDMLTQKMLESEKLSEVMAYSTLFWRSRGGYQDRYVALSAVDQRLPLAIKEHILSFNRLAERTLEDKRIIIQSIYDTKPPYRSLFSDRFRTFARLQMLDNPNLHHQNVCQYIQCIENDYDLNQELAQIDVNQRGDALRNAMTVYHSTIRDKRSPKLNVHGRLIAKVVQSMRDIPLQERYLLVSLISGMIHNLFTPTTPRVPNLLYHLFSYLRDFLPQERAWASYLLLSLLKMDADPVRELNTIKLGIELLRSICLEQGKYNIERGKDVMTWVSKFLSTNTACTNHLTNARMRSIWSFVHACSLWQREFLVKLLNQGTLSLNDCLYSPNVVASLTVVEEREDREDFIRDVAWMENGVYLDLRTIQPDRMRKFLPFSREERRHVIDAIQRLMSSKGYGGPLYQFALELLSIPKEERQTIVKNAEFLLAFFLDEGCATLQEKTELCSMLKGRCRRERKEIMTFLKKVWGLRFTQEVSHTARWEGIKAVLQMQAVQRKRIMRWTVALSSSTMNDALSTMLVKKLCALECIPGVLPNVCRILKPEMTIIDRCHLIDVMKSVAVNPRAREIQLYVQGNCQCPVIAEFITPYAEKYNVTTITAECVFKLLFIKKRPIQLRSATKNLLSAELKNAQ